MDEAKRMAMNEAAKDMAWEWYNKGVMLAVNALRDGIKDGYRPSVSDLEGMCRLLEAKTREPR